MRENYSLWEKLIILAAAVLIIWGVVYLILKHQGDEPQNTRSNTAEEAQDSTENTDTDNTPEEGEISTQDTDQESIPF
ncbi:MAG: hypothetical protein ABH837_00230 [bacterium]